MTNKKPKYIYYNFILKNKIYYFILIFLFAQITIVNANNYYVATWGNNNNSGTLDAPWKNVNYATSKAYAGDTIYLFDGTWNNETYIKFLNSGNATHPITLEAYNGTPILSGNGTATYNDGILIGYKKWIVVKNITLKNYVSGVYIGSSDNITIYNVTTHNNTNDGITLWLNIYDIMIDSVTIRDVLGHGVHIYNQQSIPMMSRNITIKNSTVSNAAHNLLDYHTNVSNSIIENNDLYFTDDYAGTQQVGLYLHNGQTDDMVIRNNNFHDQPRPLEIINSKNVTVLNNTFTNISGIAIRLVGYVGYDNELGVYDSLFQNNNISNTDIGVLFLGDVGATFRNLSFKNNYFSNITSYDYYIFHNVTFNAPIIFEDNLPRTNNKTMKFLYSPQNSIFFNDSLNYVISSNNGVNSVHYPTFSSLQLAFINVIRIRTDMITARPTTSPATVTVNSFNTSLPAGKVLVNFTTNTTNGNSVHLTISTLTPGRNYRIKKGSSNFINITADGSGTIAFDHSQWPSGAFTVQESEEQGSGSAYGTAARMNLTPIPSANVSLYYQNGAAYGQTVQSGSDGKFVFSNISNGFYYVAVDKHLYRRNTSLEFNINSTSIDIGSIKAMCYDINGDNNIDVLDLNMISQRINEITGTSYPSVDVNGDGVVDIHDVTLVSVQIEE